MLNLMKSILLPTSQMLIGTREWKIVYKIVGIVTDNAANIVSAVHLCKCIT
jgi:hypothetical protein